jgi:hypothetical protein
MADATARSGEQEGAARLVRVRRRHGGQNPIALTNAKAICVPVKPETTAALLRF